MNPSLKIQVFSNGSDGAKVPVTDARVTLARRDLLGGSRFPHEDLLPTHSHESDGFYGIFSGKPEHEPAEGHWLLVVRKNGMSPVAQRLTLSTSGDVLIAKAGWAPETGLGAQAATVSIANAGKKVKGDVAQHTTVNVTLFPRLDIVGITGHDDGGTEFALMADGRRNLLYKRKKIDDGTIATLFHSNQRAVISTIKSARRDPRSWVVVDSFVEHPLDEDAGKDRPKETAAHELSIVNFYEQLDRLGRENPGTVVEAGIFSHSWTMGPIIWNTFDGTSSVTERFSEDTDGRQKDWLPAGQPSEAPTGTVTEGPTMQRFSKLQDAFRKPDGALRIWGCSHMQNVIREGTVALGKLKAKRPRDEFFIVSPLTTVLGENFFVGGEENATLDHIKRLIGKFISGTKYARALETHDFRAVLNYPGAASRLLKTPVFGAAPGMGSLFGRQDGEPTFYIDGEASPANVGPKDARGENVALFRWYHLEFGDTFQEDDLHYVDYQKLRSAQLPDPGWRTERWATFYDQEQPDRAVHLGGAVVLRLPSALEVYRRVPTATNPVKIFTRPRPFALNGVNGHLYVFSQHVLEVVERRAGATVVMIAPKTEQNLDSAVFVGTDGRTVWLTSPAGKNQFTVTTDPLPVVSSTFFRGSQWLKPRTPLPPITDGVIEAVTPRCFW